MDAKVVAALIALGGVVVSVVSSVFAARRRSIASYAARLTDARLDEYPPLYAVLSEFVKHIEGGSPKFMAGQPVTTIDANELLIAVSRWDSEHALLLGDHAGSASYDLRQTLIPIARESHARRPLREHELRSILASVQRLELGLKVEVGVYAVETHEKRDFFPSYSAATIGVSGGNYLHLPSSDPQPARPNER